MTIVLTGGGSGGHITPVLAVAHELKQLKPGIRLVYIGQRGDSLLDVPAKHPDIDETYSVRAGKFRRYHGAGLKQVVNLPTMAKNGRDLTRVILGLAESRRLLKKIKPDVIFIKGGYVGVPVGLAAAQLHIPFVTHDSDALPGLANRIIARWAVVHAVALPKEVYAYPPNKTFTVGVPVAETFKRVDPKLQKAYKKELGLAENGKFLLVTGGGNGAKLLNDWLAKIMPELLERHPDLYVMHVAGLKHEGKMNKLYDELLDGSKKRERVVVKGFAADLYRYSGAADVIITRAGATTIAEFATQAKACIIIPNPLLTGGHQLKNAELWAAKHAALVVQEADVKSPNALLKPINDLFDSPSLRAELGRNLHAFSRPQAARELAQLILKTVHS